MPNLISETELLNAKPELSGSPDLGALIASASGAIHGHCKRDVLVQGPVSEVLDGNAHHELNLSEYPATDVTVSIDGVELDPSRYFVDSDAGILVRLDKRCWPCGRRNVSVQYTAGYDPIPAEIKRAAIITVGAMERVSGDGQDLKRLRVRDQEEEWFPTASKTSIPEFAQSLLIPYVKPTSR